MRKSVSLSFMIGAAYISLAAISLTTELPIRLVNSLSLGAVLFSISELLEVCNRTRIQRKSFLDLINQPECKDTYTMALLYIRELLQNQEARLKNHKTLLSVFSLLTRTFAVMSILVYPYGGFPFLDNSSRFGIFCTIASLGIIFFSLFVDEQKVAKQDYYDLIDLIGCYNCALNGSDELLERVIGKQEKNIEQDKRDTESKKQKMDTKRKRKKKR